MEVRGRRFKANPNTVGPSKQGDKVPICIHGTDSEKFLQFGFSVFTWRHLMDIQVKKRKGPLDMDLELAQRRGLATWTQKSPFRWFYSQEIGL